MKIIDAKYPITFTEKDLEQQQTIFEEKESKR